MTLFIPAVYFSRICMGETGVGLTRERRSSDVTTSERGRNDDDAIITLLAMQREDEMLRTAPVGVHRAKTRRIANAAGRGVVTCRRRRRDTTTYIPQSWHYNIGK